MLTGQRLAETLRRLHRKGYKNYQQIKGSYRYEDLILRIDYIQGDPFADPSAMRIELEYQYCALTEACTSTAPRRRAIADFFLRRFAKEAAKQSKRIGSGKGGLITIQSPTQAILETSAVLVLEQHLELRFQLGLPADGRRILGHDAESMLLETLPRIIYKACHLNEHDQAALKEHISYLEDYTSMQQQLAAKHLVAFIADKSLLARRSGDSDLPLGEPCQPMNAPNSLAVTLERPHRGPIRGIGISRGVCLIVGGGFHGKSTLLNAIAAGINPHLPGDGREWVVTDNETMMIQSEDGRAVQSVCISPFLENLPRQQSTENFSTTNASGSSSQAAALREAMEAGVKALLIDEDNSASNFMSRDERMQALVSAEQEPITPLSEFMIQLRDQLAISCVMVMGSSSLFFEAATQVIAMIDYQAHDVLNQCKKIIKSMPRTTAPSNSSTQLAQLSAAVPRYFHPQPLQAICQDRRWSIKVDDRHHLRFGRLHVDLQSLSQIRHPDQIRAMAWALRYLLDHSHESEPATALTSCLTKIQDICELSGISQLCPQPSGQLAGFRRCDLAALINRLRIVCLSQSNHLEAL